MDHLKTDLMMRLLDLPALSREIWADFPEDEKRHLRSYADGVNRGLESGKNAIEFKKFNYVPEAWRPEDTIGLLLLQAFDQTAKTFRTDHLEQQYFQTWKARTKDLFDQDHLPWNATILKSGEYKKLAPSVVQTRKRQWNFSGFPRVFGEESGSNSWVVSAKKSKSGKAILANDPHLDLKTPMFWYWLHLKSPQHELIGATVPGIPVVASGTNGRVAWGLTNSYINAADAVLVESGEFESFRPTVWVKLGPIKLPFFFKQFERMKGGAPVLPLEVEAKGKLVLRWSGFHLRPVDFFSMMKFHTPGNVTEMDELLKKVGLPSWNFVFADTSGRIGYRMVGKTFRHTNEFQLGLQKDPEDLEFLSENERPHVLNPKRGFVVTANNRHWPEDSAFYGGRAYSYGHRAFRIEEMISPMQDVPSTKRIQCDEEPVERRWFGKYFPGMDHAHYRRTVDLLIEKWNVDEYALFRLLQERKPDESIIEEARRDVAGRRWGEIHLARFPHLSKNSDLVFSPEISGPGDKNSVNPGTAKWDEERKLYDHYSGASMRMIIEMEKRPKIYLSLPGLNREYASKTDENPWRDWRECKYTQVSF